MIIMIITYNMIFGLIYLFTLEMRTLIPACLLSQPNSLIVSPACNTTSFRNMYSLYSRLLEALCNQAAPQSNSSYSYYIYIYYKCISQSP